jgi:hypothetical protein
MQSSLVYWNSVEQIISTVSHAEKDREVVFLRCRIGHAWLHCIAFYALSPYLLYTRVFNRYNCICSWVETLQNLMASQVVYNTLIVLKRYMLQYNFFYVLPILKGYTGKIFIS